MFSPAKIALFALLTACSVGAVPGDVTPDTPPSAGEASFIAMVDPLITECKACHVGTQPILNSYSTIIAKYKTPPGAQNILVTKGDTTGGMHYGVLYFTAAERATIAAWIDSNP